MEEQAIQASQALDVRRNLEMDIFGTDDEEEDEGGDKLGKGGDLDMFDTDDEEELEAAAVEAHEDKDLEDTLKLSETVTNRWNFASLISSKYYKKNTQNFRKTFSQGGNGAVRRALTLSERVLKLN